MFYQIKSEVLRPDVALYTDIVYTNTINDFRQQNIPLVLHFMHPCRNFEPFEKAPLLIWAEGGAWRSSSPARRLPELAYYAYHGYAVANIQYRVSSQSLWPAQIQDVKTAIRYLKAHADQLGIDADRIVIGGESAGAHLAALAALTGKTDLFGSEDWKEVSSEVQAAICWYCSGDFSTVKERGEAEKANYVAIPENLLVNADIEKSPEKRREVSPISYVTPDAPPFLFFHGDKDFLIPVSSSKNLYDRLVENGAEADYYLVEGATHASSEFSQQKIQDIMLAFMDKHLK